MAKPEKKKEGGLLEGYEGPVGFVVRETIQHNLPKPMEQLKIHFPHLYYTGAWAFNNPSPEASKLKDKFLTGMVITGWLGERLADLFGSQSAFAKVVEIGIGDLPSAVKTYYERTKPELPADFTPPPEEKFEEFVKNFWDELKEFLSGWFKDLKPAIDRILKRFDLTRMFESLGLSNTDKILTSLLGLSEPEWKKMARMWRHMDAEERYTFTRLDPFFPTAETLSRYVKMTPLERKIFMEMTEANKHRLLSPEREQQFRQWRRQVARYGREVLAGINQGLEKTDDTVANSNAERRLMIEDERFSPANLQKYPWRRKQLPPEHPFSLTKPKKHIWLGWILSGAFVVLTLISLAAGLFMSGCRNEAPHLVINSPDDGATVPSSIIEVKGQASDDQRVCAMSVKLNDQMPRDVFLAAGQNIDWSTKVRGLKPDWNTILVEVRDRQNRKNSIEIRVRYVIPADTLTNTYTPASLDNLEQQMGGYRQELETTIQVNNQIPKLVMFNPQRADMWKREMLQRLALSLKPGMNVIRLVVRDPQSEGNLIDFTMRLNITEEDFQSNRFGISNPLSDESEVR